VRLHDQKQLVVPNCPYLDSLRFLSSQRDRNPTPVPAECCGFTDPLGRQTPNPACMWFALSPTSMPLHWLHVILIALRVTRRWDHLPGRSRPAPGVSDGEVLEVTLKNASLFKNRPARQLILISPAMCWVLNLS